MYTNILGERQTNTHTSSQGNTNTCRDKDNPILLKYKDKEVRLYIAAEWALYKSDDWKLLKDLKQNPKIIL